LVTALAGPHGWIEAAVAPGNAASMRAFLAAGFRPVGIVQLFRSGGQS
jgi:RimJ/RimL family protein N-acetyltransferase